MPREQVPELFVMYYLLLMRSFTQHFGYLVGGADQALSGVEARLIIRNESTFGQQLIGRSEKRVPSEAPKVRTQDLLKHPSNWMFPRGRRLHTRMVLAPGGLLISGLLLHGVVLLLPFCASN